MEATEPPITWKTVTRKVSELEEWQDNPRVITEHAFNQLVESLQQDGYHHRIMITQDNLIIGGHQRKRALLAAGLLPETQIEVLQAEQALTPEQFARLNIRDNLGYGQFDFDKLANMYTEIQLLEWHFPKDGLPGMDFNLDDDDDAKRSGLTEDDGTPEVPVEPTTKLGDLYLLGEHRLLCGDSTNIDDVERLVGGENADLVFTDPPYGMSYKGRAEKTEESIKGDELRGDALSGLVSAAISNAVRVKEETAAMYICLTWRTYGEFYESLPVKLDNLIVWDKEWIGPSSSDYRPQHEFIFYTKGTWYGDRAQSDVWSLKREHGENYVHPTQKPVELIETALSNSSKDGDLVLDLFGGSGSTLIACEKLNRKCFMCEIDPRYVDVIIKRWEDFTGNKAVKSN